MPGKTHPSTGDQALIDAAVTALAMLPLTARDAAPSRAMVAYRDLCQRRGETGEEAESSAARFAATVIAALEARAL